MILKPLLKQIMLILILIMHHILYQFSFIMKFELYPKYPSHDSIIIIIIFHFNSFIIYTSLILKILLALLFYYCTKYFLETGRQAPSAGGGAG